MIRFTLFGFPVAIHWMFWVVSALLGGGLSATDPTAFKKVLIWVVVVLISVLWHELGHAFAFRKYGQRPNIMLYGMGGLAQGTGRLTRGQDVLVSLAGPAFGFFLGLVMWLVWRAYPGLFAGKPFAGYFLLSMLWVNIAWSLVNLLPVLPLDGGRVCAALVAGKNPGLAPKIGMVTAAAVAIYAITRGQIYIGVLFGFFAYQNWQMTQGISGGGSGPTIFRPRA